MIVNPDVDGHTKTWINRKTPGNTSEKCKKQEPIENQKNTKYRKISYVGARLYI